MFITYCIKLLKNKRIDYQRELNNLREKQTSIFDTETENALMVSDDYFVEIIKYEGERIFIKEYDLYKALQELDEQQFKTIINYYFFGMTDKEISESMGIPKSTLWDKRKSALKLLRQKIRGYEHE